MRSLGILEARSGLSSSPQRAPKMTISRFQPPGLQHERAAKVSGGDYRSSSAEYLSVNVRGQCQWELGELVESALQHVVLL